MSILKKIIKIFVSQEDKHSLSLHTDAKLNPVPTEPIKMVGTDEVKPAISGIIYLYEDSPTWSSIMKQTLEKEGYKIQVFDNPSNAVDHIKKKRPDLILMDVNMPDMNGYEATRLIKQRFENRNLPIIILTSSNSPENRMEAMKSGARTFLSKDLPLEDLIIAIRAYMANTTLKTDISQIIETKKRTGDS